MCTYLRIMLNHDGFITLSLHTLYIFLNPAYFYINLVINYKNRWLDINRLIYRRVQTLLGIGNYVQYCLIIQEKYQS